MVRARGRVARLERGAAAVELAIVLPVLLMMIGAIVDFGRMYHYEIMLTNAAREGARVASLQLDSEVGPRVNDAVGPMLWDEEIVEPYTLCPNPAEQVTITVKVPFDFTILDAIPGITAPSPLEAESTMRCV